MKPIKYQHTATGWLPAGESTFAQVAEAAEMEDKPSARCLTYRTKSEAGDGARKVKTTLTITIEPA